MGIYEGPTNLSTLHDSIESCLRRSSYTLELHKQARDKKAPKLETLCRWLRC